MKFGKQLQKIQLDIPEYAACFVNYKALKKLIKQLSATPTIPAQGADTAAPHPDASGTAEQDPQQLLQANRATFFFRLERELEKVNTFYLQKQEELELRLKTLLDKKQHLQSRSDAASRSSSTFIALEEGLQQFQNDLNKLQQYVEVNNTAFSKILKKWDKTSKSRTKELYLSRAVEVQPCFNREVISELSDQANTSLLDLGAWAEGEQIHFDRHGDTVVLAAGDERDTDSQFLSAVISGSPNSLRDWIQRLRTAPNAEERLTRVFLAAIGDAPEPALAALLETGLVNLHFEDEINDRTCLHEAAIFGRSFVVTIALRENVSVESVDVYGRIPLHYASIHGHIDIVKMLLGAKKETVNALDHDRFTPLIQAILHSHLGAVETLLGADARIDPQGDSDHIALNLACQHGAEDVVKLLLQYKPKILADAEGLFPQHWVAKSGLAPRLLVMLREYGVNLDEPDKINQWTPLFHAASEGHVECLEVLLGFHVRGDILDEKKLSAMYYAAWEGHLGCMSLLEKASNGAGLTQSPATSISLPPQHSPEAMKLDANADGIPDLSLPPPILPFRRYGHNFLDSRTFVQLSFDHPVGSDPLIFYDVGKYPTARLTVSSKAADIIPRNLMLPLVEDTRQVSFQVDSLDAFSLDFDIYPTFGAKMIARTVAPASTFTASAGRCVLPLFDPRLRAIGQIGFGYQIIHPFRGTPLEITHFATYWKATSALDHHANSLVTGSSLSGEFVRVVAQLTADGVPFLWPSLAVSRGGVDIPIASLSHEAIVAILGTQPPLNAKADTAGLAQAISQRGMTLKSLLATLSPTVNLDIHVLYDSRSGWDINAYADKMLAEVFEHARHQKDGAVDFLRSVMFSSFEEGVCTALNWKQPNCKFTHWEFANDRPRLLL
jgi:CDK inhibitor PHO81